MIFGAILTASLTVEPARDFPSELSCKTLKKLAKTPKTVSS